MTRPFNTQTVPLSFLIAFASSWGTHLASAQTLACDAIELEIIDPHAELFGTSISTHSGLTVIGSEYPFFRAGSGHLYDLPSGQFNTRLFPHDGQAGNQYGVEVGVSAEWILIAAPFRDNTPDSSSSHGGIYVYNRSDFQFERFVIPSDVENFDRFGLDLAVDGSTAIVQSLSDELSSIAGAVYLFDISTGQQIAKMLPDELNRLGSSVAIHQGYAVAGASISNLAADRAGAVYVYDATNGAQLHKLVHLDAAPSDSLGISVAIHGGQVAAGSTGSNSMTANDTGAVYVFDAATGQQLSKLTALDSQNFDRFGSSVSCDEDYIAVGAMRVDAQTTDSGAVYIFDAKTFVQLAKINAPDDEYVQLFGLQVEIHNGTLLVSAEYDDNMATDPIGKVFQYDLSCISLCAADINDDGILNFFDISQFLGVLPDYNNDNAFDFFDVSDFLNDYSNGCP